MANKATCPFCDTYTSSIYNAFNNEEECPHCKTSFDTIQELMDINAKKEEYKKRKIEANIANEIISLRTEVVVSKEKYEKAKKDLDYIRYKLEECLEEISSFIGE